MTLHRLVLDSARRAPDALAVAMPDESLTYRQLRDAAARLATRLRSVGVRRGDRVVLYAAKSVRAVAAMQAVLRAGAAYVPLDPATPVERARRIIADCGAAAVCADGERHHALRGAAWLDLDAPATWADRPAGETRVHADELAYVLYTSGSTGEPKGVRISHGNALAFVRWAVEELSATAGDRFANHAPFGFDLSVLDLYGAFMVGASVHLVPDELAFAPAPLGDFVHRRRITIWYSVPSALALMIRDGGLLDAPAPERLRAVLFAGEPFALPYVRRLRAWTDARLLNLYGPTETNVCAFHEVGAEDLRRDRPLPIGRPCSGARLRVVTPDGTEAGPGEPGELVVDGPTVMLGYWGRPPHAGPYPTGDVVRRRADGTLELIGRRDAMLKVRGHRVEPGEIESVLIDHPDVGEVAVAADGGGIDARLVAFVVPAHGSAPTILALKRCCAERLPPHMVVDAIVALDALPRTRNGKLDRAALPLRKLDRKEPVA